VDPVMIPVTWLYSEKKTQVEIGVMIPAGSGTVAVDGY
jgi:hypothetical protein